jgi:Protein of unknown function (DUF1566)
MTTYRPRLTTLLMATGFLTCALLSVTPARAGQLPATGQTKSFQADKNDGITGPVNVPDDGALQRGATLRYKVQPDGTIKDINTGLIWEVKCDCPFTLHHVDNIYVWSGNGAQDTIWDWIDAVNMENGTGYAGHNDWRIPNVRELQSIVDYALFTPVIDPIFAPTAAARYWSSTSLSDDDFPFSAWDVQFGNGLVDDSVKSFVLHVRAVRGGPK